MNKKNLKGLILIGIGLIGLISTLIVNISIENDLICITLMMLFVTLELFGLSNIIKNKYGLR